MELTIESVTDIINKAIRDTVPIKDKEFWQKKDIAKILGVGIKSVDRMFNHPNAPQPIILKGTSIKLYKPIEVNRFIAS